MCSVVKIWLLSRAPYYMLINELHTKCHPTTIMNKMPLNQNAPSAMPPFSTTHALLRQTYGIACMYVDGGNVGFWGSKVISQFGLQVGLEQFDTARCSGLKSLNIDLSDCVPENHKIYPNTKYYSS